MKNVDKLTTEDWQCSYSHSSTISVGLRIKARLGARNSIELLEPVISCDSHPRVVMSAGDKIPINGGLWGWEPLFTPPPKPTLWQRIKNWFADDGDDYNGKYD